MKKFLRFLVAISVVATIGVLSSEGYAGEWGWRLYDNFKSGTIDPNRWTIDSSSANISIVGGKAKFEHLQGHANDSAWLGINIAPETVKGIKAKVTVKSCTGDVRARIGGYIGKVENDYVFDELNLQGSIGSPRIYGNLAVTGGPPNFPFLYNLFYGEFIRPVEIIGHTFTITMIFSDEEFTYNVSGLGEIEHELPEDLSPTDIFFKGIGTRSTNGDGPCVVYFDDVYVLR
jgi:hypothetical protein